MPHSDPRVAQIAQAIKEKQEIPAVQATPQVAQEPTSSPRLEPGPHLDGGGNVIIIKEDGSAVSMEEQKQEPVMEMMRAQQQSIEQLTQVVMDLKESLTAPKEVIRGSDGLITGIKTKSGE